MAVVPGRCRPAGILVLLFGAALLSASRAAEGERCHVLHFFHVPKTGGLSVDAAITNSPSVSKAIQFWHHVGEHSWEWNPEGEAAKISASVAELAKGEVLFVHQHHMAPGLLRSAPLLREWRALAAARGCGYTAFTLLRDPQLRAVSAWYYNIAKGHTKAGDPRQAGNSLAFDNMMTRYIIGGHPRSERYALRVPAGGVNYTHSEQAIQLLMETMDVISLPQCQEHLLHLLSRRAGIELHPEYHNHNAHSDTDTSSLATYMRVSWDRHVFEQAVRLPSFMDCSADRQHRHRKLGA